MTQHDPPGIYVVQEMIGGIGKGVIASAVSSRRYDPKHLSMLCESMIPDRSENRQPRPTLLPANPSILRRMIADAHPIVFFGPRQNCLQACSRTSAHSLTTWRWLTLRRLTESNTKTAAP